MHCSSPKMVCETKIVADEHEAIAGTKKDSIIVSSAQMWTTSSPSPSALESKVEKRDRVFIREFERSDHEEVRRIFTEGIMERIPNSAFRGLKQQTRTQFIYAFLTGMWSNRGYTMSVTGFSATCENKLRAVLVHVQVDC